ncbi:MAG TPA: hypothetical protein VEC35_08065 [Noviherbaspirillum sp.]|nr:hypothetical protein [Noviherbaspirillum sp.]
MPLLHVDIPKLAAAVIPQEKQEQFRAMSVSAQLLCLVLVAEHANNRDVRDQARQALENLATPRYIGLWAVQSTLQTCKALIRISVDRCDSLVAAMSDEDARHPRRHYVGRWYRVPEKRWLLTVTARDVEMVVANLR